MRRETQNVLLVLVGGVLVKIVLDGSYRRWVAPWSGPVILTAGVVVVLLAAAAIWRDVRGGVVGGGGHDHGHGRPAWLMLLPVLAILLVAPPALGAGALVTGGNRPGPSAAATAGAAAEPLPPGEAPALTLGDLVARAARGPGGPLDGREVTLTGFVAPGERPGTTDLVRWTIACCAADATAVRVHLRDAPPQIAPAPPGAPERWWRVRGRLVGGSGGPADAFVPTLAVTTSSPVEAPDPVYES